MKNRVRLGFVLKRLSISLVMITASLFLQGSIPSGVYCGWVSTFQEDFSASAQNGSGIDPSKWNLYYPPGKQELQAYIPNALGIENGFLTIQANQNRANWPRYTSGIMTTEGKFAQTYGYFEIRAKVPKGQGLFPAFWLMPASKSWPPEIDVFEILGQQPDQVHMSVHWLDDSGETAIDTQSFEGPDFSDGFHTFAINWDPSKITWYIDGIERYSTTRGVPHEPMFLLVDLAVGGEWPGPPNSSTVFPSYMQVASVSAYQYVCHSK